MVRNRGCGIYFRVTESSLSFDAGICSLGDRLLQISKTVIFSCAPSFQYIIKKRERRVEAGRKICKVVLLVAIGMTECASYSDC